MNKHCILTYNQAFASPAYINRFDHILDEKDLECRFCKKFFSTDSHIYRRGNTGGTVSGKRKSYHLECAIFIHILTLAEAKELGGKQPIDWTEVRARVKAVEAERLSQMPRLIVGSLVAVGLLAVYGVPYLLGG